MDVLSEDVRLLSRGVRRSQLGGARGGALQRGPHGIVEPPPSLDSTETADLPQKVIVGGAVLKKGAAGVIGAMQRAMQRGISVDLADKYFHNLLLLDLLGRPSGLLEPSGISRKVPGGSAARSPPRGLCGGVEGRLGPLKGWSPTP